MDEIISNLCANTAGLFCGSPCAQRAVGDLMSPLLKETGRGGVAASPTAVRFRNDFFGKTQE